MTDAAAKFAKRHAYNNAGDFFVKETRYIYWDSGQCDDNSDNTRNQGDFGGTRTTLSTNLVRCAQDEVLRITVEEVTLPYVWRTTSDDEPPPQDDYVLLELEGCDRNIAAYPTSAGEATTAAQKQYPYEEEPVVAKIDLPSEYVGKTVRWRNVNSAFATRYASNVLNHLAFRLLDADWFKSGTKATPAVPFVSSTRTWSLVLRVETLARRHTGLAFMAESLFLQHIQVMQGDIMMKKLAQGAAKPSMPPGGDKPAGGGEPPKTPEDMFREVMAEFAAKHPSSLYPGGPGWSVNRLQQAMRPQTEQPALHADTDKNAPS